MPTDLLNSADRYGRIYADLLRMQASQLDQLRKLLDPRVYGELSSWARRMSRPVDEATLAMRFDAKLPEGFSALHSCPVGHELWDWLLVWPERVGETLPPRPQRLISSAPTGADSTANKSKTRVHTMKEALMKLATALAAAYTQFNEDLAALPDDLGLSAGAPAGGDAGDGGGDGGGGGDEEVTQETILAKAKEAIAAGKRDDVTKILKKAGAAKLSELDEKHYKAVYKKIAALVPAEEEI